MRYLGFLALCAASFTPSSSTAAPESGAPPTEASSAVPSATATPPEPTPPVPTPAAASPTEPQPAVAAPAAPAQSPTKTVVPGGLLQGWIYATRTDTTSSTFRARRAEIQIKGEVASGQVSYAVMVDGAKVLEHREVEVTSSDGSTIRIRQPASAASVFQDVFITYVSKYADVSLGQFKLPVSWEGFNSSSKLLFAERALAAREFGDKRDLGLRAGKAFEHCGYWVGLHNGAGQNNLDTNNAKDGSVRLEAYPVKGLVVGGVAYASLWERDLPGTKDRYEVDLRYERGPFLFQSEALRGRDLGSDGTAVHAQGFYAAVAFMATATLQPALRVGFLDPNARRNVDPALARGKDEVWHFDAGLNYYLSSNNAKLQLNYSRLDYDEARAANEALLAAQISF